MQELDQKLQESSTTAKKWVQNIFKEKNEQSRNTQRYMEIKKKNIEEV